MDARWQAHWEKGGYFRAPDRPKGPVFVIPHPPPNITGILTMGHMLGDTIRDTLARWHRMRGDATLWFVGVDHAGLSTQVEVRRRLARQGIALESLGRDEILAHLAAWKTEHESYIQRQLRAGGFSVDWSRYRYTMDEGAIRATRRVFVHLFERGLIYRGERIVHWDPKLRTAVSDLEVVHTEEPVDLLYVRYPWADGTAGGITVATVRPETVFGDVAVAVHPDDARHAAAVGRRVRVPLTDRDVPVIADAGVDPTFGNGALKVTPRHDVLDFAIAQRHPELVRPPEILSDVAVLEGEWVPARFRGLDRDAARSATTDALRAEGLLERVERIQHSVGRSDRTKAVIEPRLSLQWFVKMRPLAEAPTTAVRAGQVRLRPDRWELTFFRWMEALEDWCISRQVVWGHAIPVYYCGQCHGQFARVDPPAACPSCGSEAITPDPDVLDTWFTSWLWPFLALGWPDETADLAHYFPASVLVTGRDIMFFWVARMMMAGFEFRGGPPFSDVFFTGMLRDETGKRMSKHLGNSPDPLQVIATWGADAMRFALLFPNPVDQDGAFGEGTLESSRNFLTKLWNLGRFALLNLPDGATAMDGPPSLGPSAALEDRWLLSRWRAMAEDLDAALSAFEFTKAAGLLYGFLWHELADRYVEVAKERLAGKQGEATAREARATLQFVLERSLRQLHPMVPHVTEELWHALPHVGDSLAVASWPMPSSTPRDPEAELAMEVVLDAIRTYRNLRSDGKIPAADKPEALAAPAGAEAARLLREHRPTILRLARIASLTILDPGDPRPTSAVRAVTAHGEFFLRVEASATTRETVERERTKLQSLLDKTRSRLADAGFRDRAPPSVVAEAEAKAQELEARLRKLAEPASVASEAP